MTDLLLVGLGNAGVQYDNTRHNIGFTILDQIAEDHELSFFSQFLGLICNFRCKGKKIFLLKPTTFINMSGKSLHHWMHSLKINIRNILIIVDDMNLPFSSYKLSHKSGDGGHNGLKNITNYLQTDCYAKLRMGISFPSTTLLKKNYVLSRFSENEMELMPIIKKKATEIILHFCNQGLVKTMNKYNRLKKRKNITI